MTNTDPMAAALKLYPQHRDNRLFPPVTVIAARWTQDGSLAVLSGPEKMNLGTPKRSRKVYCIRVWDMAPAHAPHSPLASRGFSWSSKRAEAEARFNDRY
jgi:hypothetical protein